MLTTRGHFGEKLRDMTVVDWFHRNRPGIRIPTIKEAIWIPKANNTMNKGEGQQFVTYAANFSPKRPLEVSVGEGWVVTITQFGFVKMNVNKPDGISVVNNKGVNVFHQ